MHFHCTQCRHQFCSGCYNAFYAKNVSSESGGGERGGQLWGWGQGLGESSGRQDRKHLPTLFPSLHAPDPQCHNLLSLPCPPPLHRGS